MKNTRSGEEVEIRPTAKLLELLGSFKPKAGEVESDHRDHEEASHHDEILETLARQIAAMPESQIAAVKRTRE